jgi:hypothetical protein
MNWIKSSQKKYKWSINTWKHVQHFNPKGNSDQNVFEISSYLSQTRYQGNKQQQMLMKFWGWREGTLYMVGGVN